MLIASPETKYIMVKLKHEISLKSFGWSRPCNFKSQLYVICLNWFEIFNMKLDHRIRSKRLFMIHELSIPKQSLVVLSPLHKNITPFEGLYYGIISWLSLLSEARTLFERDN